MTARITKQGMLDFSVAPRQQTMWGSREGLVFSLEGVAVTLFVFSMFSLWTLGMLIGLVALSTAILLLLSHLGQPLRAWRAIINVRHSWISRGTFAMGVFWFLGIAYLAMHLLPELGWATRFEIMIQAVLSFIALFILLYPGFAMAASAAIAFWTTPLQPLLSLVNGLASGLLVHAACVTLDWAPPLQILSIETREVITHAILLLAIVLVIYLLTIRGKSAAAALSVKLLFTSENLLFGVAACLIGIVLPSVCVFISAELIPLAAVARLVGDVSLRYAVLKVGLYESVA